MNNNIVIGNSECVSPINYLKHVVLDRLRDKIGFKLILPKSVYEDDFKKMFKVILPMEYSSINDMDEKVIIVFNDKEDMTISTIEYRKEGFSIEERLVAIVSIIKEKISKRIGFKLIMPAYTYDVAFEEIFKTLDEKDFPTIEEIENNIVIEFNPNKEVVDTIHYSPKEINYGQGYLYSKMYDKTRTISILRMGDKRREFNVKAPQSDISVNIDKYFKIKGED